MIYRGLEVALFGHVHLSFGGKPFEFSAPRKTLPILAYLLVHRQAAISREFLAFLMWPDAQEEVARNSLRRNLTLFKQILPPAAPAQSWILATNELVRWNPEAPFALDVAEFDRLCGEPETLAQAVELYGGDLLEDLYDDWVYPERERLRAAYLTALKGLVRHHRSEREFGRAIGYGQRLLAADPLREDVAREIAATRYQAGDRAGALAGIDEFVKRLRADLGIDAMPETQTLRESILRGAPARVPPGELFHTRDERRPASAGELPFAGRDAPLERAAFLWDQTARGAGGIAFVGGEAGIGKTRFVAELALRAEEQGGRILIGATTGPEAYPYQAFCEALRGAIPLLASANLERVWLGVLASVIPELGARVDVEPVPALRPDEERTRLFEAFTRAFRAIARARPLLLVLEDMHWCETASAELLGFVANRIAAERIAIVATYRSEEIVRSHPLRPVRRALQTHGASLTIELPRLDRAAIDRIVSRIAENGSLAAQSDAGELYARSLGNPLFLGELIREGSERTASAPAAGGVGALPATIESTIAARLARLADDARRVAGVCAVVGDTFDFEIVGEVTGWESSVVLDALDELVERHVIRETTRRERGAYAFTHHLIRETAYAELPSEVRRRYHSVVARALGALHAAESESWAAELARHYESAGEALEAAHAWLRAARTAFRGYANAEALSAATRGLNVVRETTPEVDLKAELLTVCADAADRLGDSERQGAIITALIELAHEHDKGEVLRDALRRELELAHVVSDEPRARAALAALSREIAPEDVRWRAEFLKATAQLAFDYTDFEVTLDAGAAAIDLYRSCADQRGEFDALLILIETRNRMNRYEENQADLERASEIAQALGDPLSSMRLLQGAMVEPFMREDFPTVYRMAGDMLDLSRSTGNRRGEGRAYERRAWAAKSMFAIAESIDGHAKALAICESIGDLRGSRTVENNWGSLEVDLGMLARGRERIARLLEAATADDDIRMQYFAVLNLGVAANYDGDFAAAKGFELRALLLSRRLESEALAAQALGCLGTAERELGELDPALAHLEEAVATHRRLDQRLELWTSLARLSLVRAARGDFERARAIAREVVEHECAHPEVARDPAEMLWDTARALHACGDECEARNVVERAVRLQEARIATIDLPEYRESASGMRWYRALLRVRSEGVWPGDGGATDA
jgi:DNA-binding SARP family transcriptional activator/tetratricopeptide (TPR) repeat protein